MTDQSTLDALADAECLRLVLRTMPGADVQHLVYLHPAYTCAGAALRITARLIRRRWSNRAHTAAMVQARAAFRAVPALRESA